MQLITAAMLILCSGHIQELYEAADVSALTSLFTVFVFMAATQVWRCRVPECCFVHTGTGPCGGGVLVCKGWCGSCLVGLELAGTRLTSPHALPHTLHSQDIAVDGWALTLLSPANVAYASTCQTM